MGVNYGGMLGKSLKQYPKVYCCIGQVPQVQIVKYRESQVALSGAESKCRHCKKLSP